MPNHRFELDCLPFRSTQGKPRLKRNVGLNGIDIVGRLTLVGALVVALLGCDNDKSVPRYELRWCANGESNCQLTQNEGTYVKGGYFYSLDQCNGTIKHLAFYGNKVAGQCIEIPEWQKSSLNDGKD